MLAVRDGGETECVSTDSLAPSKLISQRFRLTTQTAIPRSLTLADPTYSRTAQIHDGMVLCRNIGQSGAIPLLVRLGVLLIGGAHPRKAALE